ncbi:MAG TPA: polysaccharide biosynthesis tyrosine autokinase [Bryobacteraceae bacterium]|nr:polysaccharide biosynthesis tyrosine autokinase [Bryobacteraceae bacterium]
MIPDSKNALIPLQQGPPAYYIPAPPPAQDFEPEAPAVPLSHYLWILRRHAWKIVVFVVTCVAATFIVSSRLTPVYESSSVIDVDRQAPSAIVGQDSSRVGAPNDADQFLATQVKLIQSDAVLRPVAQKYNLLQAEQQFAEKNPGLAQRAANAPVLLKRLKVTRPPNTYLLFIAYRSTDPQIAADVANAVAQSYLEHTYNIRIRSSVNLSHFMEQQLEELRAKMEKSGQALAQFERELNLINPEEKTNILSARLLQLNQDYTAAQSDRVKKEAAYNSMKTGSLEAAQVSGQGEALILLTQKLNEARQRFAEVKTTYGTNHPEFRKAASQLTELLKQFEDTRKNIADRIEVDYKQSVNREQMLHSAVGETKAEYDRLNSRSFEYQQLKREAEADKKLYDELVTKIKEAGINAGFQNNNIRIADSARPALKPVFPNLSLNLLLAFLFSGILAIGAAVLSDTLDTTVRDPEQASRYLGTDVIGILPAVKNATQLNALAAPKAGETALAKIEPTVNANGNGYHRKGYYRTISGFEEAIRTLRNTILLGDFDSRICSILVTSAGPGEGKTTACAHLAIAHAEQGKKTLLVDADLRRPSVHRKFGMNPVNGLTNVLMGEIGWRETVIPAEGRPNLHIIPAGPPSHRASDLVGPRMAELLDEFGKEYDLVLLDAPPLLGFAEPLQMATVADGVLVISRAGETKRKAVSSVLSALNRLRANVVGVVLNQVKRDTSDGYSYYGYYRHNYYTGDRNQSSSTTD